MLTRMGVIMDLAIKNNPPFQLREKYQYILDICSSLINLYDSENPGMPPMNFGTPSTMA